MNSHELTACIQKKLDELARLTENEVEPTYNNAFERLGVVTQPEIFSRALHDVLQQQLAV